MLTCTEHACRYTVHNLPLQVYTVMYYITHFIYIYLLYLFVFVQIYTYRWFIYGHIVISRCCLVCYLLFLPPVCQLLLCPDWLHLSPVNVRQIVFSPELFVFSMMSFCIFLCYFLDLLPSGTVSGSQQLCFLMLRSGPNSHGGAARSSAYFSLVCKECSGGFWCFCFSFMSVNCLTLKMRIYKDKSRSRRAAYWETPKEQTGVTVLHHQNQQYEAILDILGIKFGSEMTVYPKAVFKCHEQELC